jgi:hypothetical protein
MAHRSSWTYDRAMVATELAALFARDLTRLGQEIEAFPDEASIWATLPGFTNSAGTLTLHLEGNVREYIGRQLGSMPYERDRPAEFATRGIPKAELLARVSRLRQDIPAVIASLPVHALDGVYPEVVLGAPLTTRQFLVHLQGHLNYHLGQIDCLRRVTTGGGALPLAGL